MENNELEEMRAQLATLNGKLDNESIVDERHFSKATKKHLSELQRKLIVRIVIITLWAAYFYCRQGNSASMPVTEYARRLRKTLKIYKIGNRFLWILTILLIMAWGVYVFVLSVSYRPSGAFVLLFVCSFIALILIVAYFISNVYVTPDVELKLEQILEDLEKDEDS